MLAALLTGLAGAKREDVVSNYSASYDLIKDNEEVINGIKKFGEALYLSVARIYRAGNRPYNRDVRLFRKNACLRAAFRKRIYKRPSTG